MYGLAIWHICISLNIITLILLRDGCIARHNKIFYKTLQLKHVEIGKSGFMRPYSVAAMQVARVVGQRSI